MKKICIIDCGSNKAKNIINIVVENGFEVERWYLYYPSIDFKLDISKTFDKIILIKIENNQITTSPFNEEFTNQYKSIIFSGGGLLEEIQNEIKDFFSYLKEIAIPVLGICFGHQIMGLVFGAKLYKLNNHISGSQKVKFLEPCELYKIEYQYQEKYFEQNHSEAITLPNNFNLLATSSTCENEMMRHKSKSIYSVQFHPEVSEEIGLKIVYEFCKLQ